MVALKRIGALFDLAKNPENIMITSCSVGSDRFQVRPRFLELLFLQRDFPCTMIGQLLA